MIPVLTVSTGACAPASDSPEVVVYASIDQPVAEPVLDRFEAETGIAVKAVYDTEAAKTTGLVSRLLAEKGRPQADVWWSGEFAQTVELANQGVLEAYRSPEAADLPAQYVDPDGVWTGFGGRARVFLVNTESVAEDAFPRSIFDLVESSSDKARVGLAHPLFGTTATQAAALYAVLGPDRGRSFYDAVWGSGVQIVDGNSVVRDQVAAGQLDFGLTDTDDACGAIERGAPVAIVFPDQEAGAAALERRGRWSSTQYAEAIETGIGTLIIPNTVALVDGGPNPDAARALVDFLLRPATTSDLVAAGWFQLTLRPLPDAPQACVDTTGVRGMDVSLAEVARWIEPAKTGLAEVFVR